MDNKWEYAELRLTHTGWAFTGPLGRTEFDETETALDALNAVGRAGWEAYDQTASVVFLKRRVA